jgi:hypothetical protein
MLFGETVALSETLTINRTIANDTEFKLTLNDAYKTALVEEPNLINSIIDAMVKISDRLISKQSAYNGRCWPNEEDFTGSIVAGMVGTYELTGEGAYCTSAELGGNYILENAEEGFYGDEAFALVRLVQISSQSRRPWWIWWNTLSDFYAHIFAWGSDDFISQFINIEPSVAVFYLANHVVATHYVHAVDKEIWREALIYYLSRVDDESADFPVMALGVATWALAQTGPLDDTLVDPSGTGAAYWNGVKLVDLPNILLSHQVPEGGLYAGSFYWRFDHGDGGKGYPVSGYTEDAIFATLGLISASKAKPELELDTAILKAGQALLGGVSNDGKVSEHLGLESQDYCTWGGEMLQALGEWAKQ